MSDIEMERGGEVMKRGKQWWGEGRSDRERKGVIERGRE